MVGWRWPPSANGTPGCRAWDSGNSGNSGTGHGVRRSWGISYRNHEDIPILERFPQIFSRNSGYFCRLKRSHGISGLPLTLGVDQWWYQMDSTYKLWWDNGDFCGIYWDTMGYMIMDWFKGKFTVLTACGFCHEIWRCPVQFRNKMPLCHSQFGRYKKKALMVDDSWGNMGNHVLLMEFSHFWCITILRVDATTEFYDTYRVSSDDTNSILWMLLLHQNPYKALISVVMILSPFLHQNPQRWW